MGQHKEIVIWGTGDIASLFYYQIRDTYEVEYFLDNAGDKEKFKGKIVRRPAKESIENKFIVVANTYYNEIKEQLREYGCTEIVDFIPYGALGKDIVLVHGNCHTTVLKQYMESSEEFKEHYYIWDLPVIQDNQAGYIEDDLLSNCDVFIHQDIKEDNMFGIKLSDEYILPRLGKAVRSICIPNLFGLGKGFFPQTITVNEYNPSYQKQFNGIFPNGDENIDQYYDEGGKDINSMIARLKGSVYSEEYIKQNFNLYMERIIEREKNWDVKVSEWILKNYKTKKIFYDVGHPCIELIREICVGVFRILNIETRTIGEIIPKGAVGPYEQPIYPCVSKTLGLGYADEYIRRRGIRLSDKDMDFEEYCREYWYWCFE